MSTIWLDVPGYEGLYKVSSDGDVWSHPRERTRGGILIPTWSKGRRGVYASVRLWKNKSRRTLYSHQLVLLAFRGPTPEGMESRHLDGDSTNNQISNLSYCTHQVNCVDIVDHGHYNSHNKKKTHCPNGHEYSYTNKTGRRICTPCGSETSRRNRAARKARS